jgi:hypothetical protein
MTTWAIKDSSGQTPPGFLGSSRIEVGCKVMPARYDAFRLHVSIVPGAVRPRPAAGAAAQWVGDSSAIPGDDTACGTRPCTTTSPRTLREHGTPLTHVSAQASREGPRMPCTSQRRREGAERRSKRDPLSALRRRRLVHLPPPGPVHDCSPSLWLRHFLFSQGAWRWRCSST